MGPPRAAVKGSGDERFNLKKAARGATPPTGAERGPWGPASDGVRGLGTHSHRTG